MAAPELARTPTNEPTVDVLIRAYNNATRPNPFTEGNTGKAKVIRERIEGIPFAPYWTDLFAEFENRNANPAGMFARDIFQAAETQEGNRLFRTVAAKLAENFGEHVLEADLDIAELKGVTLVPQELGPLAQFLRKCTQELETHDKPTGPRPRKISDAWVLFAYNLWVTNPKEHDRIFRKVVPTYSQARISAEYDIKSGGLPGEYDIFSREHEILPAVAKVLTMHFPDIVVSKLKTPSQRFMWNLDSSRRPSEPPQLEQ